MSFYGEQAVDGVEYRPCVIDFLGAYHLTHFVKFRGSQSGKSVEVADNRNFLVFFLVFPKKFLHLPCPHAEFLWRLIYHLRLQ